MQKRYMRIKSGIEITMRSLAKHLRIELCNARIQRGITVRCRNVTQNHLYQGKYSDEFSATLETQLPRHLQGKLSDVLCTWLIVYIGEGVHSGPEDPSGNFTSRNSGVFDLPPNFNQYAIEMVQFEDEITAEAIFDHCSEYFTTFVTFASPQEYGITRVNQVLLSYFSPSLEKSS